jgi:uncharacterized membrane protein (UPF0127 family)
MEKRTQPAGKIRKKMSPLVIIGGSVVLLAIVFFVISRGMLENRDPAIAGAHRESAESNEGSPQPGADGTTADVRFRDDATLTFLAGDGSARAAVRIEIAEDEASRTQGLMGRRQMGEDQGMLFIFPDEEYRSFWMANTPLPLDIIYVNRDREIVTIQRNTVPYSEESIPSTRPATYVIEVNAGFADRHGITEGEKVQWLKK